MTGSDFSAWSRAACRGSKITYHVGNLMYDRQNRNDENWGRIDSLGRVAYNAAMAGRVRLFQKRIGPDRCAYIAVRL